MELSLKAIATVSMILFAVIDIIGCIPLIIDLKQKGQRLNAGKTTLVSLVIMIVFLLVGESLLGLMGVDIRSFAIAGSIVLFLLALEMLLGIQLHKHDEVSGNVASIVPMAFPFIAGPGIMTALLSLRAEYHTLTIIAGILINILLVYAVLRLTGHIERVLGQTGIVVLRKFFGIILLAIAVKLFRANTGL